MSYTKTTWVNNTSPAINQNNLNKIETGIYNLHTTSAYLDQQVTDSANVVDQNVTNSGTLNRTVSQDVPLINEAYDYTQTALENVNSDLDECVTAQTKVDNDDAYIDNIITTRHLWNDRHIFGIDYYANGAASIVCKPVQSFDPPVCYFYDGILYLDAVDEMEYEEEPILIGG